MAYLNFGGVLCVVESRFEAVITDDEVVAGKERHDGAFADAGVSDDEY